MTTKNNTAATNTNAITLTWCNGGPHNACECPDCYVHPTAAAVIWPAYVLVTTGLPHGREIFSVIVDGLVELSGFRSESEIRRVYGRALPATVVTEDVSVG